MFCSRCGGQLAESNQFCPACGQAVRAASPTAAAPAPAQYGQPVYTAAAAPDTSGKAIASLICGLLFLIFPSGIAAVVLGVIARADIKKSAGKLKGDGMALVGIILGAIGSVIPIILIIAAIAIPNLIKAKIGANETSAQAVIRSIGSVQISYATDHPERGFACSLQELNTAGLIDGALAAGKNGYRFEITGCEGTPATKFQVVAYPITIGTTGVRAYCADESGVMRADATGSAEKCLESGTVLR